VLRVPDARPLGGGLFELRFTREGAARRVTYYIDVPRKIITLTVFRTQRQNGSIGVPANRCGAGEDES
jgi:hypothetical protein